MPATGPLARPAVARLLGAGVTDEAVLAFIRQAPILGIDLGLMAAVVQRGAAGTREVVRQVCLPVVGAGRTVMLFVSGGGDTAVCPPQRLADRAAAITAALDLVRLAPGREVHLAQALIEPREAWAAEAYEAVGLTRLAELRYLSRPLRLGEAGPGVSVGGEVRRGDGRPWPGGLTVRPISRSRDDEWALRQALHESYRETLDCPELAGLRTADDIVAAHRAVGEYDPGLWWLVERTGRAEGCVLLNRCPEQGCVELVYIGLSPAVRGLGVGGALLETAVAASAGLERELRCAVDERNAPARRLYERTGFHETGRRVAFVGLVKDLSTRKSPTG